MRNVLQQRSWDGQHAAEDCHHYALPYNPGQGDRSFFPLTDTDTERQFSPTQFNELWQEGGGVEMLSKGRDYYVELGGR